MPARSIALSLALLLVAALTPATRSEAQIAVGATAPDFTKTRLGGGSWTLSQSAGKVRVLFLLGYG